MTRIAILLSLLFSTLAFRGEDRLFHRPLVEDAYYYFQIARHAVEGRGISADGEHLTNGFHPLFFAVCAGAFAVTPNDTWAIRLITLFLALVQAFSAVLFGRFAAVVLGDRQGTTEAIAALTYAGSMFLFWQHQNGLETGLVLLLLLAVGLAFTRTDPAQPRSALALGALCGLLVLARIDTGILVVMLAGALLLARGSGPLWRRVGTSGVVGVLSTLVSLPWWLYNVVYFGSFVPTSGRAQQAFAFEMSRVESAVHAVATAASPFLYPFGEASWAMAAVVLVIPALAVAALASGAGRAWRHGLPDSEPARRARQYVTLLVTFALLLAVWYCASSWAAHFYRRYVSALSIPGALLLTAAVLTLKERSRWVAKGLPFVLVAPSLGLLLLMWFAPDRLVRSGFFNQLELVRAWVPENERVAAFQSGTLGFFRPAVVNLDGKVNPQALAHRGRMATYLDAEQLHWLCDVPSMILFGLGTTPEELGWKQVANTGDFTLYHRL
ncbi:glycosyltransferase family 39 protein [Stigmatella aurantiaca]|uniref:Uncharacterized protein n=1 Tax=Stigmatella aurantiaca (strain DW4/3-1) TaxID=378806 RepID=E3FVW9_STIAD|nr:glycosyltransferase family 39 protein [Stigmatella aurantiaca]ADO73509.1 uncharacterized protein STAUR_5747 [Stigmatella aurantiaca DW4/3-1]